jgi:hypothetical protein
MGRISASHVAGLDLIDKLFFNQTLVICLFQEELIWLRDLDADLKRELTLKGITDEKLQIVRHGVLCLFEANLSESLLLLKEVFKDELPEMPENITMDQYEQLRRHDQEFFQAMVIAMLSKIHHCDMQVILDITNILQDKYKNAPATFRYRLVERMFSYEFVNAPIDCFTWLSKMGVLDSGKYPGEKIKAKYSPEFLKRLALLCEFDTQRACIRRAMLYNDRKISDLMIGIENLPKKSRKLFLSHVAGLINIDIRRDQNNSFSFIDLADINNPVKIQNFFNKINSYGVRLRVYQGSLAGWIGMLCGGMVEVYGDQNQKKAIYSAEYNEGSLTEYISNGMSERGFRINARTIYERHRDFKETVLKKVTEYYNRTRFANVSIPPAMDDFWYEGVILSLGQLKPKPRRHPRP